MLGAFANAFRTPDLRKKLLFVLLIIVIFRLGSQIPTPGVNVANVQSCFDQTKNDGLYGLINLFSGGALLQLTDLRARHHALHHREHHPAAAGRGHPAPGDPQEGGAGRADQDHPVHPLPDARAGRSCRPPASWPSPAAAQLLQGCTEPLLYNENSLVTMLVMVITMTAGTAVIMWLGELITDRGIGNGMSILIFTSIVATFPASLWAVRVATGLVGLRR